MKTLMIGAVAVIVAAAGVVGMNAMPGSSVSAAEPVALSVPETAPTQTASFKSQPYPWASARYSTSWNPGDDSTQTCQSVCDSNYRFAVRLCFGNTDCLLNALSAYYECAGNC